MSAGVTVLALNCGSSSLKFGLYRCSAKDCERILEGEAEEVGAPQGVFWVDTRSGRTQQNTSIADFHRAGELIIGALNASGTPRPQAVGHRIVHGGPNLRDHCVYTPNVEQQLARAVEFAPLHVPAALQTIAAFRPQYVDVPHVLCFDTAFHRTLPDVSAVLPLPAEIRDAGIRRYGFHGLALESVLSQLRPVPERLIAAHLGNGCSVTAISGGRSVDTTMCLTPNAGIMMGTRCGDVDPGIVTWLMRHRALDPGAIDDLLNRHSGLLGVSGTASDVRQLLACRSNDDRADLALRMFCHQAKKAVAAMAASIGGVDAMVFTGGIGEHATELRDEIVKGLTFLQCSDVRVITSAEDVQIANIAANLTVLTNNSGPRTSSF